MCAVNCVQFSKQLGHAQLLVLRNGFYNEETTGFANDIHLYSSMSAYYDYCRYLGTKY